MKHSLALFVLGVALAPFSACAIEESSAADIAAKNDEATVDGRKVAVARDRKAKVYRVVPDSEAYILDQIRKQNKLLVLDQKDLNTGNDTAIKYDNISTTISDVVKLSLLHNLRILRKVVVYTSRLTEYGCLVDRTRSRVGET